MRHDRLLKLALHLEKGKLGHDDFYFNKFSTITETNTCQTLGCAIGECPFIFDEWDRRQISYLKNNNVLYPHLKGTAFHTLAAAQEFFEISYLEAMHLFIPISQDENLGTTLDSEATKEEVAANIRKFVEIKCKEKEETAL